MIRFLFSLVIGLFYSILVPAQQSDFISRGKIEYEIRFNQKRAMADYRSKNANNDFLNALPDFDVSYYNLNFSWGSSLYSPGRSSSSSRADKGSVYIEKGKEVFVAKRRFYDKFYVYTDSLKAIKWKIQNETRKIAGFECRKAVGKLPGDVYVVAFYSLEMLPQAGPEFFTGLPGMILGVAVPQWYTTWFATKLELANVDEAEIKAPSPGKSKVYKPAELAQIIYTAYKEYLGKDATVEKVRSMFFNNFNL
jgi:GLPGLI family protein